MLKLEFPEEARRELLTALEKMLAADDVAAELDALLSIYDENELCDYKDLVARAKAAASRVGIHEYTAQMLLYLALGERLKERYIERGLDLDIFYASLSDLRYKLEECRLVHGIVGGFSNGWFQGFYQLDRFALGRLQFEIRKYDCDFLVDGVRITNDTKVINIHIPRTGGRLDHDEVLRSYALAAEFFRPELDGEIIFHCNSWLLDPFHEKVLAQSSNMMKFIKDFTIVETGVAPDYSSAWRLFDKMYTGNPDELPADSSLRRAYVERIRRGEPLGWGQGFFIYK